MGGNTGDAGGLPARDCTLLADADEVASTPTRKDPNVKL